MERIKTWPFLILTAVVFIYTCGPKVMVPPRITLKTYGNIGMIEFSSAAKGNLQQFATQEFLETIQESQPGLRILELGEQEQVLKAIRHNDLDLEAIQAIGEKYNVDAIIAGQLDVTDIKPKVRLSTVLRSMSAEADVEAFITVKLFETENGATVWTSSARGKETVAHVTIFSDGPAFFDADDPENAYGKLIHSLVKEITRDFRVRYVRK